MKNKNQGFSILITIIIVVILAALGVMGISMLTTETQMSVDTMTSAQALFIAEGGLQYYFEQLQGDSDWTTPPTTPSGKALGNGTFTITTANATTDEIDVTSTANVTGADGGTTARVATAHLSRGASLPLAYDYVLYANTITLLGSPSITGTQYPGATIFPTVTFASYQSAATYNLPGGSSLSGTYNGGVYVSGNVTIGANSVVINGFLVATGNITSTSRTSITINPTAPYPAMIANNDISFTDMRGTNTMNGLIFAGADGTGSVTIALRSTGTRNFNYSGTIMAPNTITLNRNAAQYNVVYDAAIKTNPPPYISGGGSGTGTGGMSSWKEV